MFNDMKDREIACDAEEIHLYAYNAAFHELGLRWHWDSATYRACAHDMRGLRGYIERWHPHLLNAYDIDFLSEAIEAAKARCYATLAGSARLAPSVDWAAMQAGQVGF